LISPASEIDPSESKKPRRNAAIQFSQCSMNGLSLSRSAGLRRSSYKAGERQDLGIHRFTYFLGQRHLPLLDGLASALLRALRPGASLLYRPGAAPPTHSAPHRGEWIRAAPSPPPPGTSNSPLRKEPPPARPIVTMLLGRSPAR